MVSATAQVDGVIIDANIALNIKCFSRGGRADADLAGSSYGQLVSVVIKLPFVRVSAVHFSPCGAESAVVITIERPAIIQSLYVHTAPRIANRSQDPKPF